MKINIIRFSLTDICFVWWVCNDSQLVEDSSSKVIGHQREAILSSFELAVECFMQVSNLFLQFMFWQRDQFYITVLQYQCFL
jgi:PIN domain nuclease of toxin-antitoxin system